MEPINIAGVFPIRSRLDMEPPSPNEVASSTTTLLPQMGVGFLLIQIDGANQSAANQSAMNQSTIEGDADPPRAIRPANKSVGDKMYALYAENHWV